MGISFRPLKKSIVIGCVLLLTVLCAVLSMVNYFSYKELLLQRYQHYMENILTYTASYIDTDDLEQCIRTGEKSEKFQQLQQFMDQLREEMSMHFLYVVVPLNDRPEDNMKNVLAAVTQEEYANGENTVELNQLTGDAYSPETADLFLDAYYSGRLSFFEEVSQWGNDYTGLLPLKNSEGVLVAALCIDVDVQDIYNPLWVRMTVNAGITLAVGVIFIAVFLFWSRENITKPIEQLEASVVQYASLAGQQRNPEELLLQMPDIKTGNEVESLARAVEKMSYDIRESVVKIITTEQELARMNVMANKDGLTHVGNKNAYRTYVSELQNTMMQEQVEFAIVVMDANRLKYINDTYGHEKGDLYLKQCCSIICEIYRHSPVFRIGGDEFVVMLRNRDYNDRETLMTQAISTFLRCSQMEQSPPWQRVSAALGMAVCRPGTDVSVEDVFNRADQRMYAAKVDMKATRE